MIFAYNRKKMAQALSVVGEAGVYGMKYNGGVANLLNLPSSKQSMRLRWSCVSAHKFSGREFEEYLILAWRFGYVERSKYKESDREGGLRTPSYIAENEVVLLTEKGWEYVATYDVPLLHRWAENLSNNIPTIVSSVIVSLLLSWISYKFGPPLMVELLGQ
ncbi:hypothetical protein KO516_09305 [Citreicella sp. C3M06]|uniref:hypothetical protein n=1 Tax=Citreicella sp. C3M06 TaxID=2841564 RepID=UPI001C0853BE|nr:hypothetical protein [Citreicella sp. C3M06]MBU2961010.1 hypothetical protein [Citreicella sp. C3M06]